MSLLLEDKESQRGKGGSSIRSQNRPKWLRCSVTESLNLSSLLNFKIPSLESSIRHYLFSAVSFLYLASCPSFVFICHVMPCLVLCSRPAYCYCRVTQQCLTLCNPMDSSMPLFPVLHHLLEFSQPNVH